jgi:tetratricopeptide (TPR) repeat protein
MQVICLILLAFFLVGLPPVARAQTDADAPELQRAVALAGKGDLAGALAASEGVLTHAPNSQVALYESARVNFALNNVDAARGRLERMVKLSGNNFSAWELMVQVTQVQGDLARRDQAIDRLKSAIETAIDPDVRSQADFIRDRILIGDNSLMAAEYFQRGGSDFTRYQFSFGDPRLNPDKGLLLRTDEATTQNWADTALLAQDKQLFHLDMVDLKPEGGDSVAIYEYYVGEPSYDKVRAKVLQILRGQAQPLSGSPGSLQGVMK